MKIKLSKKMKIAIGIIGAMTATAAIAVPLAVINSSTTLKNQDLSTAVSSNSEGATSLTLSAGLTSQQQGSLDPKQGSEQLVTPPLVSPQGSPTDTHLVQPQQLQQLQQLQQPQQQALSAPNDGASGSAHTGGVNGSANVGTVSGGQSTVENPVLVGSATALVDPAVIFSNEVTRVGSLHRISFVDINTSLSFDDTYDFLAAHTNAFFTTAIAAKYGFAFSVTRGFVYRFSIARIQHDGEFSLAITVSNASHSQRVVITNTISGVDRFLVNYEQYRANASVQTSPTGTFLQMGMAKEVLPVNGPIGNSFSILQANIFGLLDFQFAPGFTYTYSHAFLHHGVNQLWIQVERDGLKGLATPINVRLDLSHLDHDSLTSMYKSYVNNLSHSIVSASPVDGNRIWTTKATVFNDWANAEINQPFNTQIANFLNLRVNVDDRQTGFKFTYDHPEINANGNYILIVHISSTPDLPVINVQLPINVINYGDSALHAAWNKLVNDVRAGELVNPTTAAGFGVLEKPAVEQEISNRLTIQYGLTGFENTVLANGISYRYSRPAITGDGTYNLKVTMYYHGEPLFGASVDLPFTVVNFKVDKLRTFDGRLTLGRPVHRFTGDTQSYLAAHWFPTTMQQQRIVVTTDEARNIAHYFGVTNLPDYAIDAARAIKFGWYDYTLKHGTSGANEEITGASFVFELTMRKADGTDEIFRLNGEWIAPIVGIEQQTIKKTTDHRYAPVSSTIKPEYIIQLKAEIKEGVKESARKALLVPPTVPYGPYSPYGRPAPAQRYYGVLKNPHHSPIDHSHFVTVLY